MSDPREVLQKIAAMRVRLDQAQTRVRAGAPPHLLPAGDKVEAGTRQLAALDRALRPLEEQADGFLMPARLTSRGARLLEKAREILHDLKSLAGDALLEDYKDPLAELHREAVGMIEVILRTIQAFPPAAAAQLRLCEGLEALVRQVETQLQTLKSGLWHRNLEIGRVELVAEHLKRLWTAQETSLQPLQKLAEEIFVEAQRGQPLRFPAPSFKDVPRFVASHGIATAQVAARLILKDQEWFGKQTDLLLVAFVHDLGMLGVPADVLLQTSPFSTEQKRLVEKHPKEGAKVLAKIWGSGWQLEAVLNHHERNHGSGYPAGRSEPHLSTFTKLLSVCDVYAALASPRPHRLALDTRGALTEVLVEADRGALDKRQAEKLLALSFYPVGSVVELNDGAVAMVIATHPGPRGLTHPTRPVVVLLRETQGQMPPLPALVDLLELEGKYILRGLTPSERRHLLLRTYPGLI